MPPLSVRDRGGKYTEKKSETHNMLQQDQYAQTNAQPGHSWLKMLDDYEVRLLALDLRKDNQLVALLQSQPGWVVDFADQESVLFVRSEIIQA